MKKRNLIAFVLFFLLLLAGYFYSQHPFLEEGAVFGFTIINANYCLNLS
ncbi:hypothetical protein [Lysinibacillus sp. SGAir0095]|nr:hypothetical protein [Lysinibacillus sp. SGAir0095]